MYNYISAAFTFKEDTAHFNRFIKMARWHDPICVFSDTNMNVLNLVSSIAKHYGIQLMLFRTDPVS